MSLLTEYNKFGAKRTSNFTKGVILGLRNTSAFASLSAEVDILETLNETLKNSILPFTERTSHINDRMVANTIAVKKQLNLLRKPANEICDGDDSLERLSGFTPSKKTRSTRVYIDAVHINSALPTGTSGQLLFKLQATIPGNMGYEVHYLLDGKDYIVGVAKVKRRNLEMLVTGFPSLQILKVYLITLSTNNVRSEPSNMVTTSAS